MNHNAFFPREARGILWEVLLAILFGGVLFVVLTLTTGGVLVSLITAAVAMGVFGLFHYLIWGQALLKSVARERETEETRARLTGEQVGPADEFTLTLGEQERATLMDVLEQSLAETPVEAHQTPRADGRQAQQRETIREVLGRLRGFGA